MGVSGGAGGSAGDRDGVGDCVGDVDVAVREVSDDRSDGTDDPSVDGGTPVWGFIRAAKWPCLSRGRVSIIYMTVSPHVLCEAATRLFSYSNLGGT